MLKKIVVVAVVTAMWSGMSAAGVSDGAFAAQQQGQTQQQQQSQGQITEVQSSPQGEVLNAPSTSTTIQQNYHTSPTAIAPSMDILSNGPCSGAGWGISVGAPGASVGIGGTSLDQQCEKRWNILTTEKVTGNKQVAEAMTVLEIPGAAKAVMLMAKVDPTANLHLQALAADAELQKAHVKHDWVPQG